MSKFWSPASCWWDNTAPATKPTGTSFLWVGVVLSFHVPGRLAGFRIYCDAGVDGNFHCFLWETGIDECKAAWYWHPRGNTSAAGWWNTWTKAGFSVDISATYRLAVCFPGGQYMRTNNLLNGTPLNHNNIEFLNGFTSTSVGVQEQAVTLSTFAPGIDVLFRPS